MLARAAEAYPGSVQEQRAQRQARLQSEAPQRPASLGSAREHGSRLV